MIISRIILSTKTLFNSKIRIALICYCIAIFFLSMFLMGSYTNFSLLLLAMFIVMFYDLVREEKHPGLVFLFSFIKLLLINVVGYIILDHNSSGILPLSFSSYDSNVFYPSIFLYLIGIPLLVSYAVKKILLFRQMLLRYKRAKVE